MIGYVITTHYDNYEKIFTALNSLKKNISKEKYFILFDNEGVKGKKEKLLSTFDFIDEYHTVDDQSKGGLTFTWNKGISICLEKGCEGVILLNHDIKCNSTLHFLEDSFLNKKEEGVYSCTTNKAPWGNHLNQESFIKKFDIPICEKFRNENGPGGFCLAIPKNVLIKNKFNENNFFNPKYRFGGNERHFNNRWYSKGGYCYIVRNCFIEHFRDNSWLNLSYAYDN